MSDGGVDARVDEQASDTVPRPLWRNRDFMVLWTGQTVSTLGSSMSFFVFPLLGYSLSHSTTQAALAGSAYALGSVAPRLPAGVLVDRWNRRTIMCTSNALGAVLYASLGVAMLLHALALGHLVAVALLTGVAACFYGPAETAAVRTIVPALQLPTAFSQNQARQHVAALIGPPLGGVLYGAARWLPFGFDAITYAISALAVTRIRTPLTPPSRSSERTSMRHDILEGLRFLMSRGFLRAVVAFASVANFTGQVFFLVLTLKLLQAGVHPAAIGLIDTIGAVAGIAGSMLAPMAIRRIPTGALSIAAGLLLVPTVVPMAYTNNVPLIGGLLALALLANPAGNAAISSYLVATTPDRLQGRTQSALQFCATSLQPLGPVVGGALMGVWGGQRAMLAAAALLALSVLPLLISRETRRLPTPDRWPSGGG
jgi:MFS family permease